MAKSLCLKTLLTLTLALACRVALAQPAAESAQAADSLPAAESDLTAAPRSEIIIPLHHGCGQLVYTRVGGWDYRPDTTGTLHFPRQYFFNGDLGHSLCEVVEFDADSTALNRWRMWPTDSGIAVEQEPFGRCFYDFDSLGCVAGICCENADGHQLPSPAGLELHGPGEAPAAGETPAAGSGYVYAYDSGGNPLGQVRGEQGTLVLVPGIGADGQVVCYADPVHDPPVIRDTTLVETISAGDVHYSLKKVNAYAHHGLISGIIYLKRESEYYGLLDFARNGNHPVHLGTFYVTRTRQEGPLAHNNYNFGNFLWGAAAQAAGVPLWIAKLGSHISNMMHTGGQLDSPDDMLSISAGYHFSKAIGPAR